LGDKIKEPVIVKKALRYLPMRFDSNILSLEERVDLATMTMDHIWSVVEGGKGSACSGPSKIQIKLYSLQMFYSAKQTKEKELKID
jgi:hypothetical protein